MLAAKILKLEIKHSSPLPALIGLKRDRLKIRNFIFVVDFDLFMISTFHRGSRSVLCTKKIKQFINWDNLDDRIDFESF